MVQYILPYVRLIWSLILVLFQTEVPFCTFNRPLKYKLHAQYIKSQWYITTEFTEMEMIIMNMYTNTSFI